MGKASSHHIPSWKYIHSSILFHLLGGGSSIQAGSPGPAARRSTPSTSGQRTSGFGQMVHPLTGTPGPWSDELRRRPLPRMLVPSFSPEMIMMVYSKYFCFPIDLETPTCQVRVSRFCHRLSGLLFSSPPFLLFSSSLLLGALPDLGR